MSLLGERGKACFEVGAGTEEGKISRWNLFHLSCNGQKFWYCPATI